jgi:hypothetical protein
MRSRILVLAFLALTLGGCPAGGFFGRYLIVNNTGTTITNLKISVGNGREKVWDQTLPGQGWIEKSLHDKSLTVSWSDDAGYHEKKFSFEKKTGYRSYADLHIELNPQGKLTWRIIEPAREEDSPLAIVSLVLIYIVFCVAFAIGVGVWLALASLTAYGLFTALRSAFITTMQGLRGDRTAFQFTIREIFLLTAVVALASGWILHFLAGMKS